jgi:hypothetical protein
LVGFVSAATVWRLLEVGARAWTTTDVVPFLVASFTTSPLAVLDVAGENLPLTSYIVSAFSVVFSWKALLGVLAPRLLLAV